MLMRPYLRSLVPGADRGQVILKVPLEGANNQLLCGLFKLALRRPYTFVVAALLLLLLTPFILLRTPTDIFPAINIPVVSVIWQYTGLDAQRV